MIKFIALEGLDGVGKSSLARGLAEKLQGKYMNTPSASLAEYRAAIMDAMGDDQLARALFYASTVSAQGRRALTEVNNGYTVIMDRYWPSTVAYAKARGVKVDLNMLTPAFVTPDLVVLITLDEQERRRRLNQRDMTPEDHETLSAEFTHHVISELAPRCQLQVDISGMDEQEAVSHLVIALQQYFH